MRRIKGVLRGLAGLYPDDVCVKPSVFDLVSDDGRLNLNSKTWTITFESVQDKFYFLLWGAINKRVKALTGCQSELVVVQGLNGAVGFGWSVAFKRSWPIAWLRNRPWVRAYGTLIQGVGYWCSCPSNPWQDIKDFIRADKYWREMKVEGADWSIKIGGVEVVDLVNDSYLRYRPSPRFDVADPFVRVVIWRAIREVRRAERYFTQVAPKIYCTSYTTYLEHGIPARVALRHGVDVWSFGSLNQFAKRLSSEDSFHTPDFSSYRATFGALDMQDQRQEEAREKLNNRLSGGVDDATSYMRKSAYANANVALPDGLNGAVVVFLHDFYDSPHVYPDLVFDDFWCWICFTIEKLEEIGARYFLKPHPNQIALSDAALLKLREKYPDLRWLSADVSNVQLADAGISSGVTVYGTVAHELAYLGVPSICCARHPHHAFDFCRTAKNKEEYAALLKTYWKSDLNKDMLQQQALAFYYMHNIHDEGLEQQMLRQAFVDFWKSCNVGTVTEALVLQSFQKMVNLPAFEGFIHKMLEGLSQKMQVH